MTRPSSHYDYLTTMNTLQRSQRSLSLAQRTAIAAVMITMVVPPVEAEDAQEPSGRGPEEHASSQWSGTLWLTQCTRLHGAGRDACASGSGVNHPLTLSLRTLGDHVVGTLSLFRVPADGPAAGLQRQTIVNLHSLLTRSEDQAVVVVADWALRPTSNGFERSILRTRRSFRNLFGWQVFDEVYQVSELLAVGK